MDKDREKQIEINKNRNELVVKRNELIRNTRYDLSLTEQKIITYIISKINAEDSSIKNVRFNISEYCDVVGISKGGRGYELVKESIREIRNKSWWIKLDKKEILFSWIDTATIEENSGNINITLSESLKPFLINIKENFTKYELINILVLNSKYSIRLYELFKSYLWLGGFDITIEDFRKLIGVGDKYKDYTELKRNIILPCINEINKYTDLDVSFDVEKRRKSVYKLKFKIQETVGAQLTLDLIMNQKERLNS